MNLKNYAIAAAIGATTLGCQDQAETQRNEELATFDAGYTPMFPDGYSRDARSDSSLNDIQGDSIDDAEVSFDTDIADIQEICRTATLKYSDNDFDIFIDGQAAVVQEVSEITFDVTTQFEVCPSNAVNVKAYKVSPVTSGEIIVTVGTEGDGLVDQVLVEVENYSGRTEDTECVTEGQSYSFFTEGGYLTITAAEGCSN